MNTNRQSRRHYRRFYRLAAAAVIVMTAVVTGSLILGDSVRGTLVDRVQERLGSARTVITSGTGFMSRDIMNESLLKDARCYLITEGFISDYGSMIPVMVWGTDDGSLKDGEALINKPLSDRLSSTGAVVLHLPSNNLVPSGSLFVSQAYTGTLRLSVKGIKSVQDGGNMLLRNEQIRPLNIFVNRGELAGIMELDDRINLIMSDNEITDEQFAAIWNPVYSGITQQGDTVTTDRVFMPASITAALQPQSRYLAYFVNSIGSIPYSFVTATDGLKDNEVMLSDYAADLLHAAPGDEVSMEYFIVKGLKQLETRSHTFRVSRIAPLGEFEQNPLLTASFPGLSNVERCTDWDSDLPIDMNLITDADEDYWTLHRQTPKAIVSYDAIKDDWAGSIGDATAVTTLLKADEVLTPENAGITVARPREAAILAARTGTDFSSLFLGLGFFIILSAILLMVSPITGMLRLRSPETALYSTLGYSTRKVLRILSRESMPVIVASTFIGVAAGFLYAFISLRLLSGAWSGATRTQDFGLHCSSLTLVTGWASSLVICIAVLFMTIRRAVKGSARSPKSAKSAGSRLTATVALVAATIAAIALNFLWFKSIIIFVICGVMWIVAAGMAGKEFMNRKALSLGDEGFSRAGMFWCSLHDGLPRHRIAYWTLAAGVFTVFAVGLNRPDFNRSQSVSTGGFNLYLDCRIPIQYDLNEPGVRKRMTLQDLPADSRFLQLLRHSADEAGCLNLNRVTTPSVIGMEREAMHLFGIDPALAEQRDKDVVPVIIDSEALLWSLMMKVGDTITYRTDDGRPVNAVIAGTYPTGIFHGYAVMERETFRNLWPLETGSSIVLSQCDDADMLSIALSDYGPDITTTKERLEKFFEVTDTYLNIFLSLGGLGLLLGIAALVIVIRNDLSSRSAEIGMFSALGFSRSDISAILRRDNTAVPVFAVITGAFGSLISISANAGGAGSGTLLTALFFFMLFLIFTVILTNRIINQTLSER